MESLNPLADLAGGASEANHTGLRLSEGGIMRCRKSPWRRQVSFFSGELKNKPLILLNLSTRTHTKNQFRSLKSHFWEGTNASRYNDIIQIVSSALYLSGIQTEHSNKGEQRKQKKMARCVGKKVVFCGVEIKSHHLRKDIKPRWNIILGESLVGIV